MKPKNVLPIALATIMLLAVVSSTGVVTAKGSTAALTPNEQLLFFIASLYKFWQSKMNPTLPGQIELTQPITMLLNGVAQLVGGNGGAGGFIGGNGGNGGAIGILGDVAPPVGEG